MIRCICTKGRAAEYDTDKIRLNGQVAEGTYAEAETKAERGLECVTTTEQARGR